MHAILADPAQIPETEHLEAPGIRQDRSRPVHEIMQVTVFADDVGPRAQHQVKGVAKQNLRPALGDLFRTHALDRAVGAHGHESRRVQHTAGERQATAAGIPALVQEFKPHHCPPGGGAETLHRHS